MLSDNLQAGYVRVPPEPPFACFKLEEFDSTFMGSKSININRLSVCKPEWVSVPKSICVPFQVMEHAVEVCEPMIG